MTSFSESIMELRYSWEKGDGEKENWQDIANRVVSSVFSIVSDEQLPEKELIENKLKAIIGERKFIPGGRFLAQSGRGYHQTNNCFLLRAEDTREGWGDLLNKATLMLMSGGGIGIDYSDLRPSGAKLKRSGGTSSGPIPLMKVVNEVGRGVMSGGKRRCLPEGTLVHTKYGIKKIENILVGDLVKTTSGFEKVSALFDQGEQETIVIKTQIGNFECTGNHKVAVLSDHEGNYKWKAAKDLNLGDRMIFVSGENPGTKTKLPNWEYNPPTYSTTCVDISIPELDRGIAWLIGLIHGDGNINITDTEGYNGGSVSISCGDEYPKIKTMAFEQLSRFGTTVAKYNGDGKCCNITTKSWQLANYFHKYIKQSNKSIVVPEFIMNGTVEVRSAYLAGLFDADGSHIGRPVLAVASIYPDFLNQVKALYASIGIVTRMKLNRKKQGNWKPVYHIVVAGREEVDKFIKKVLVLSQKPMPNKRTKDQFGYTYPVEMLKRSGVINNLRGIHNNHKADITVGTMERVFGEKNIVPIKFIGKKPGRIINTYDIEVENKHEFVINDGLLVHNSAIWAGLRWSHPDIFDFIAVKNWIKEVRDLKEKDFDFPAPMDMTNVSVILDKHFFDAYHDPQNKDHNLAQKVYWEVIKRMLKTGEPGFSVDYKNAKESLRNACFTGDMQILTSDGYRNIGDLDGKEAILMSNDGAFSNGKVWSSGIKDIVVLTLSTNDKIKCTPDHVFMTIDGKSVEAANSKGQVLHPFIKSPELNDRYIFYGFVQGDGQLTRLSSSAHLGIEVNIGEKDGDIINLMDDLLLDYTWHKNGGTKNAAYVTGIKRELIALGFDDNVLPLRKMPDSYQEWSLQLKASFLNGCFSANGTVNNYGRICYKSSSKKLIDGLRETLEKDFGVSSYITTNKSRNIKFKNGTYKVKKSYDLNISAYYDKMRFFNNIGFYMQYKNNKLAKILIDTAPYVKSVTSGSREKVYDFSEPRNNWGVINNVIAHNCTEIVSEDDSDVCCLGSINLPRIESVEELAEVTELAQLFLIVGIMYSDTPTQKVREIRQLNMRTGLGIMGFHEWLIRRGYKYEPNDELAEWLSILADTSDVSAKVWADKLGVNEPIKKRAIAPNGSISIAGGQTTSGIEPIFSVAYQRRYLTPEGWKMQYVVDPVAERLHEEGYDVTQIEDAYTLSQNVEKRIKFQAFVQEYIDNGISSTVNLPAGSHLNGNVEEFGNILIGYLPRLRGITVYPDGARGGQPLTPVSFDVAIENKNVVFEAHEECVGGICGL